MSYNTNTKIRKPVCRWEAYHLRYGIPTQTIHLIWGGYF